MAALPESGEDRAADAGFAQLLTLVLWSGCIVIGLAGVALPYQRPVPPPPAPEPVVARVLEVELTNDPLPPPAAASTPAPAEPPPLSQPLPPQPAPPLLALAEPSPAVAFALPVEGPARLVEPARADYVRQAAPTNAAPNLLQVQPLTYGQGEGRQPAPSYPPRAIRQGQEGAVRVRFTVGEEGRVLTAEAAASSPWPLLNEAAVRAVRERWRFQRGPIGLYEVPIRFELTH